MTSEQLFYDKKTGFDRLTEADRQGIQTYAEGYKTFLDEAKTERDAVKEIARMAEAKGFRAWTRDDTLKTGDKIYRINRHKGIMLAVIGEKSLAEGVRLTAAHLDAPRVDIRTVPLYEDNGMAFFKTHYYGGIKKYQWTTIPLELRGVVCVCDKGEVKRVEVRVGDKPGDPKFVITDLLPHLAANQMSRKATEIVKGEGLNILIGSIPYADEGSDRVKLAVMSILNDRYGIVEEDFLSAELTAVPAFEVREIGLDCSLIGGYGHDDRVCAYAELKAILDLDEAPEKTAVCILADKEETGSDGVSGMQSSAFECFMEELCAGQNVPLRRCFKNSFCLSADVTAAFDPNFPEVSEKRNDAKLNYGMGICKFTGARGKSGTSDASAEIVGYLRRIFADAGVVWQMSELGKVDQGGGGTIAKYMANRNIDTIDAGVPVMSMHAPFEVVAKFDCFMTYLGVLAAYKA